MKKQKSIKEKGITLVVLVVTIIILLILAGITIVQLTGNDLLEKTQKTADETNKQTATERINLKITNLQIASYIEKQEMPTLQYLADGLCEDEEIEYVVLNSKKTGTIEKIEEGEAKSIFTKIKQYPYEFEINSSLQLASINGVKIAENNAKIDELKIMIQNLNEKINMIENDKITSLEAQLQNANAKIETLENETIVNKRIKLINSVQEISLLRNWPSTTYGVKDVTLDDSIENYKYLEIQADIGEQTGCWENTMFIAREQLNYNNANNANWYNSSIFSINVPYGDTNAFIVCWLKNSKILCLSNAAVDATNGNKYTIRIKNIYGIK